MPIIFFRRLFAKDDPMIVFGTPTDVNVDAKKNEEFRPKFGILTEFWSEK